MEEVTKFGEPRLSRVSKFLLEPVRNRWALYPSRFGFPAKRDMHATDKGPEHPGKKIRFKR